MNCRRFERQAKLLVKQGWEAKGGKDV